ncbi:MAG: DinB family protein [Aggregatilineales bacterium]
MTRKGSNEQDIQMDAQQIIDLVNYHHWATERVWQLASALSDAQYYQPHIYSVGGVHQQFVHMMKTDIWALTYVHRDATLPEINDGTFTERHAMRAVWHQVEAEEKRYWSNRSAHDPNMPVQFPLQGGTLELTLWHHLLCGMNHGVNHRAQILRLLADYGIQTDEQGYFFYRIDLANKETADKR